MLLRAIVFKGGAKVQGMAATLLRATIAALLDSSCKELHYPVVNLVLIADVSTVLASGDRATIIALVSKN
ncbi:MAG: hypothetical protein GYA55_08335 [SAR324 cluster bacterium]|uniref:Uncharacterized protein n=1 Tax=SAR324 cluster bacterium TaxID=2024889 RepID=A0A7X9IJI8_9DELT|nr:hypothetical protein [SAR324 cluster bacterium]